MKKQTKIACLTALVAAGIVVSLFKLDTMVFADSERQEVEQVVDRYVNGLKNGDVEAMVETTVDIRYSNDAEKKKDYEELRQRNHIVDVRYNFLKQVDNSLALVMFETKTDDGNSETVTLPVYKLDGDWKLVVGGSYGHHQTAE